MYYVFLKPDNFGYVSETRQQNLFTQDYTFLYESANKPDIDGKIWDGSEWVKVVTRPEYISLRAQNYPKLGEQLDCFWHAMNVGTLPKIEPFYSDIKKIKDKYPKG